MKSTKLLLLAIYLTFISIYALGQDGYGNIWHFGINAGLDFNAGSPIALTNGALITDEGCATICDANGNLLFYTDGITVWNRLHQPMPNSLPSSPGGELLGNPSSTQSGVIVPVPGDSLYYYIFTVDNNTGANGCCYSMVDMSANGGYGDVLVANKNTQLFPASSEKIAAVAHQNGTDIWVITHPWNTSNFNSYLITANGIATTPVVSSAGTIYTGGMNISHGYLKPSPDGSLIGAAIETLNKIELFHFDNSSGLLSLYLETNSQVYSAYGVEFSPNGKLLYASTRYGTEVYQWDLSLGLPSQIIASRIQVASLQTMFAGALQLAPDGKIYLARNNSQYLGAINFPNTAGAGLTGCFYQDSAVYLNGMQSSEGLPTFIATFFVLGDFMAEHICFGDTTSFSITNTTNIDSVYWDFNDPQSSNNYSSDIAPNHVFSDIGSYDVSLVVYAGSIIDTFHQEVQIFGYPQDVLGTDTLICLGDSIILDAGNLDCLYNWSNGSTTQSITVSPNVSTTYTLNMANQQCVSIDSIHVHVSDNNASFTASTLNCYQDEVLISFSGNASPNAVYNWNFDNATLFNGAGSGPFTISWADTGNHVVSLSLSDGVCAGDTNEITLYNPVGIDLSISGTDVACYGESTGAVDLTVLGYYYQISYLWNHGYTSQDLNGILAGNYAVTVNYNYHCTDTISQEVKNLSTPLEGLIQGHNISCFGNSDGSVDLSVSGGIPPYSYHWSLNGETTEDIDSLQAGVYSITVIDSLNCEYQSEILINEPDSLYLFASPDVTICIGETIDLSAMAMGGTSPYTYEWIGFGSTESIYVSPLTETTYSVSCTDFHGCTTKNTKITVSLFPPITSMASVQNDSICWGDSTLLFAIFVGGNGGPYACIVNGQERSIPFYVKPDSTTTYTILGYDDCGSPSTFETLTVAVIEPPENSITANVLQGCAPLEVNFSISNLEDNEIEIWYFEDYGGSYFSYDPTPKHIFNSPGNWTISMDLKNSFGCSYTVHQHEMITVFPKPEANFLAHAEVVNILDPVVHFENLSFPCTNSYWNFGDGTIGLSSSNQVSHTYSDTGQFLVTLIAENQHFCRDTFQQTIFVHDINEVFYTPNAINPNSENEENRIFKPAINGLDDNHYYLIIFNRWGEKIFESFNINHGWDGRVKNQSIVQIGSYTWMLNYRDINGKAHHESGHVTIIDN